MVWEASGLRCALRGESAPSPRFAFYGEVHGAPKPFPEDNGRHLVAAWEAEIGNEADKGGRRLLVAAFDVDQLSFAPLPSEATAAGFERWLGGGSGAADRMRREAVSDASEAACKTRWVAGRGVVSVAASGPRGIVSVLSAGPTRLSILDAAAPEDEDEDSDEVEEDSDAMEED
jgi:hypothetical protein